MEAEQTAVNSTSSSVGYHYATVEAEGDTRLWIGTRAYERATGINSIGYNGSYWLLGGEDGKLAKYDGSTWTDLTSSANFGSYQIAAIEWNASSSYWLIGGGDLDSTTGLKLLKYDGSTFTDLTSSMSGWTGYPIQAISWNPTNNYFLIGGGDKDTSTTRLNKYDGSTFTDLSGALINFVSDSVNAIAYNSTDNYFLIGGGDSDTSSGGNRLNRYDGSTFTDLASSLVGWSTNPVLSIAYNSTDNYFLVGGGSADDCCAVDRLNKYDGSTFTDLTSSLTFNYGVQDIAYNSTGNYFVIAGGDDDSKGRIYGVSKPASVSVEYPCACAVGDNRNKIRAIG